MESFITNSPRETVRLGRRLGEKLKNHDTVFLKGELGAGKTAFIGGLCRGLGIKATVTSPTFAIVNRYEDGKIPLYHFDMYRIETEEQLYNTGFYDYRDYDGVIAVEWSENIREFFPYRDVTVTIEKTGDTQRKITIEGASLD